MSDAPPKPKRPRRIQLEDKPAPAAPTTPARPTELIPSHDGGLSALASAAAPFIFFDGAPNFGVNGGVVNVTLEAVRFTSVGGEVLRDRITVAHLRMSLAAAESLKTALDKALLLARPVASREKN